MSGIRLICGDCVEVMRTLPENSVDAVVTDPPYLLSFMGQGWDTVGDGPRMQEWHSVWAMQALRVLKPGGHLLAFGGTRTYHRLACAIEDAGFEVRDSISWLYGSGFPKSLDVSKAIDKAAGAERKVVGSRIVSSGTGDAFGKGVGDKGHSTTIPVTVPTTEDADRWQGWGTSLKPAHEIIIVARKPLSEPTVAANVLRWGTGALNIDACRIELNGEVVPINKLESWSGFGQVKRPDYTPTVNTQGRWPANVCLDEEAAALLDTSVPPSRSRKGKPRASAAPGSGWGMTHTGAEYSDMGGPSRFFYVAKASRKERGEGNDHPTVKPVALMRYLVRLVTPPGGTVLDPFAGSGATALACKQEGFRCLLIEKDAHYCDIARTRCGLEAEV